MRTHRCLDGDTMALAKPWTKELALQALADFIERAHRYPLAREANSSNGLPTRKSFEDAVGMSYNDYGWKYYSDLMEKNQLNHKSSSVLSRKTLREGDFYGMLLAVQRFYLEHGRMPEQAEYTAENGLPSYAIFTHYALDAFTTDIEKGINSAIQSRPKTKQRGDAR